MTQINEADGAAVAASDAELMRRFNIPVTRVYADQLAACRRRMRRARWSGALVGLGAFAAWGQRGQADRPLASVLAFAVLGYVLGSGLAEAFASRSVTGTKRGAWLKRRTWRVLLPTRAAVLPLITLSPVLFAPLLLLGEHHRGVLHLRDASGSAMATATWFSAWDLTGAAALASVVLLVWLLALRRLSHRPLPAVDSDAARLEEAKRVLSARSITAAAASTGLCLLSGVLALAVSPSQSMWCTRVSNCHFLYSWHDHYLLLDNLSLLLLLAAFLLFIAMRQPAWAGPASPATPGSAC